MQELQLNGTPFSRLRICYYRVMDMPHEKPFLDKTDEEILKYITKDHETAVIIRIEEVEVLSVVTHIPIKCKLDIEELKNSISHEDRLARDEKIASMKNKYQ